LIQGWARSGKVKNTILVLVLRLTLVVSIEGKNRAGRACH
jgi:hypothetical protein